MRARAVVSRLVSILSLILIAILAVGITVGYALTAYSSLLAVLETEAEINARLITAIINSNPRLWEFEQVRMEEILSRRSGSGTPEARRVFSLRSGQVAASVDALSPPVLTRSADVFDSGVVVGRIDISRSLQPLLARSSLLLLAMILLAGLAYRMLRVAPLRLISEQERELRESEEKFRKLIQTSSDAIIVFDRATDVILDANQSALTLLDMPRERVIGMAHSAVYPPADAEKNRQRILHGADTGTVIPDGVFVRGARGARIEVEVHASPAELDGRQAVQCRFEDVTVRKQVEEKLMRVERVEALSVMSAGIAHQFNNINTAVLGYLHILDAEPGMSASSQELVHAAQSAVQRAVAITSRLEALTRPAGPAGSVLAGDVTRRIVSSLLPDIEREGVSLSMDLKDTRPASMSGAQLDFIIRALIENARHALLDSARRVILVETADSGGETLIRVTDTGIGISPETRKNLFTPFFTMKGEQAPSGSPQMAVKGVGLSLAVIHAIVSGCGGKVQAESDGRTGAVFSVWIPCRPEEREQERRT